MPCIESLLGPLVIENNQCEWTSFSEMIEHVVYVWDGIGVFDGDFIQLAIIDRDAH
jgi:hypothetical protein